MSQLALRTAFDLHGEPSAAMHSDTSVHECAVKARSCGGCADDMAPCCASLGVVSGDTIDSLASTVGLPPIAISAYNQLQPAAALQPGPRQYPLRSHRRARRRSCHGRRKWILREQLPACSAILWRYGKANIQMAP